jgi:hypothetical protein
MKVIKIHYRLQIMVFWYATPWSLYEGTTVHTHYCFKVTNCLCLSQYLRWHWMNEWMNGIWVWALPGPMHLGLRTGPLCPMIYYWVKGALFLYQNSSWPPIFSFLISSGSKKKEPRYVCLSEAKASHAHKMWTEVSSSVPHFLQVGLLLNPIIYRCLLRM